MHADLVLSTKQAGFSPPSASFEHAVVPRVTAQKVPARLKILYVITRAEHGGAQVHLRDLIESLEDEVEAVIATGEDGFLCEEADRLGVRVYRMQYLIRPIRPWTDIRAIAELSRIIRIERPDLVHAHTSKAGIVGRLAAALTRTPRIFTAHSWSFVEGSSWLQDRISALVERYAAKLGGPMIMVSEANRTLAMAKGIGHPEQLVTVWNGMRDTAHRAQHRKKETPRIAMVARFAPQKDHETLLRALAPIESPWRLVLAGDGPLLAKMKALAAELAISGRVQFVGATNRVSELLAQSDIFVLSSFNEGLPLSVLEAMRAGLPVVATDVGGTAEAVTDGVNGYLIGVADSNRMRERITELLEDAKVRAQFGAASRARFEKDFRLQIKATRTMSIYRKTLAYAGAGWLKEMKETA